jgi:hypothetical protein
MEYSAESLAKQLIDSRTYLPKTYMPELCQTLCKQLVDHLGKWKIYADGYDTIVVHPALRVHINWYNTSPELPRITLRYGEYNESLCNTRWRDLVSEYWKGPEDGLKIVTAVDAALSWEANYRKFLDEKISDVIQ